MAVPRGEHCVTVADTAGPCRVTVLTVDDQAVFRRAARELIAATPGFEQVGEAASGREALELAAALRPDLVLLDVRMRRWTAIETARRLLAADPETVVVLISMDEIPEIASAVASGAPPTCASRISRRDAARGLGRARGRRSTADAQRVGTRPRTTVPTPGVDVTSICAAERGQPVAHVRDAGARVEAGRARRRRRAR